MILFSLLALAPLVNGSLNPAAFQYQILHPKHVVSGLQNALIILVDFQDVHHTKTVDDMRAVALTQLNAYYSEISYNHISIGGAIFGWYTMSHTMGYYGHDGKNPGDDDNVQQLATDAVLQLPTGTDVSSYSYLVIVHAGKDQADDQYNVVSDEIWSSCYCAVFPSYQPGQPVVVPVTGKVFPNFAFLSEFNGVGTFAHEWGHLFGLPDLYDTDTKNSYVGFWSLMDDGNYCCYSQSESTPSYVGGWGAVLLGWLAPAVGELGSPIAAVNLMPLESPQATAMVVPVSASTYYFVEERAPSGMDGHLPGSGILVYFVDESLETGHGILRLVNPQTNNIFPEQNDSSALNGALFSPASHFTDQGDQVYLNFLGTNPIIALYTTQPLTGSLLNTQTHTSQTALSGEYDDKVPLTVLLLDQNGAVLTGQSVNAEALDASGQWQVVDTSTTGENGIASFDLALNFEVGIYDLRVSYPGGQKNGVWYLPSSSEIPTTISPAKMIVSLPQAQVAIVSSFETVVVTDGHGNPIPNVLVTPYVNENAQPTVNTDSSGSARFPVPVSILDVGQLTITVQANKANYKLGTASGIVLVISLLVLTIILGAIAAITALVIIRMRAKPRRA